MLFKSLQHSTFSKLANEAFPKVSFDETNIKRWLNLIQSILRYKAEDRPSAVRIHEHPLISHFSYKRILLEPDFMWMKFILPSPNFGDFSNAVASYTNDSLDADFLTAAKGSAETLSMQNDLTAVKDTEKKLVSITSDQFTYF